MPGRDDLVNPTQFGDYTIGLQDWENSRRVTAYSKRATKNPVGGLTWLKDWYDEPDGSKASMIHKVVVNEPHRRRGLATEMLKYAREVDPTIRHSHALTPEGRAWAEARP